MLRVVVCAGLGLMLASSADARPPQNADMSLAPWFQSLLQPKTGMSCCSMADCRQTDFRIAGSHYEALVEGEWREVPRDTVLEQTDNPTGRAVVCYTPTRGIMCFIRGPET
jgi:hypothetical protein